MRQPKRQPIRVGLLGSAVQQAALHPLVAELPQASCVPLDPAALAGPPATVDAVICCEGATISLDAAIACLQAGKHLLLPPKTADNPRPFRYDAASALAAAVPDGVCLMVRRTSRHQPSVCGVQQVVASGKLGAAGLLRVHRWQASRFGTPDPVDALADDLDLALWIFGARPQVVYCQRHLRWTAPANGAAARNEPPPAAHAHLGFAGGGMALLDVADGLPTSEGYFSLSVIGAAGAAHADDHHNLQLAFLGGAPSALFSPQQDAARLAELQEFAAAIAERRAPLTCAATETRLDEVLDAARRSADAGEPARLPTRLPNLGSPEDVTEGAD